MLQAVIVGIFGGLITYVMWILICVTYLVGPVWYLMILITGSSFAFNGLMLNLYTPPTDICLCFEDEDGKKQGICEKYFFSNDSIVRDHNDNVPSSLASSSSPSSNQILSNNNLQVQAPKIKDVVDLDS